MGNIELVGKAFEELSFEEMELDQGATGEIDDQSAGWTFATGIIVSIAIC